MDPYNVDTFSYDNPYGIDISKQRSSIENAMLIIHPWMLLGSVIVLFIGGIYAGIIHPILFKILRIKYFVSGYAHDIHTLTTLFSAIVGLCIPVASYLIWMYRESNDASIINTFFTANWNALDYWNNTNEQFIMPALFFWYIYGSLIFMLIIYTVFAIFARWEKPVPPSDMISERHAFIIVAHNSSKKLSAPIEAILKFARPHQIFIADNGSSEDEQVAMRAVCENLSEAGSRINIAHLKYGNKTLAQYGCVLELIKRYSAGTSSADIVTLIDDDVFIPDNFPGSSIENQFTDPSKIAIAYPLRIANSGASIFAAMQDAEYFTGNVARNIQDLLGSQLFASGAIATWKIHQLQLVLERHCTAFNGEDLEMGYLLHKLCSKNTSKLEVEGAVRIGYEPNCVVPTTVPVCIVHWYDFVPNPLKRKMGVSSCKCGEASFFSQRVRSWDPACHQFFFKFLKVIFSPRGFTYAPNFFIRVICLWKVISLIREYMLVIGIVISLVRLRTVDQLINLAIFYVDCIIVSWAICVVGTFAQSWSVARQKLAIRPDIAFSYPILLELPYGLLIRLISVVYSFSYYIYAQRFPKDIRSQMESDPEKAEAVTTYFSS